MAAFDDFKNGDTDKIKEHLRSIDITRESKSIANYEYQKYFLQEPGTNHYKLLAWVSSLFPGQVVMDIGTHYGCSSLAMSHAKDTRVISYDIQDLKRVHKPWPENCEYKIGDFRTDAATLGCPLIFIDVDPHDGIQEKKFHDFFIKSLYKGIVLWDDIHLSPSMKNWWSGIKEASVTKIDLTPVGHVSGTGMTIYD